tara:strand:- start:3780 stop:5480 length:1701 start_codon:yes stop_codon:yes gene_type:complete
MKYVCPIRTNNEHEKEYFNISTGSLEMKERNSYLSNPMKRIVVLIIILSSFMFQSTAQTWQQSFTAGSTVGGKLLGGSEVLQIVQHKGALYATVGYWEDGNNVWYGGSNNSAWGYILKLGSAMGTWQQDHALGGNNLRPEIIKSVVFTKDGQGNSLATPDTVLIAAAYSPNFITSGVFVNVFVRNDATSLWDKKLIHQGTFPAGENYSVRDMEVFTDPITGKENIYISIGTKGIFTGTYKASVPGKIVWDATPEMSAVSIRPLGIATANDSLYFSSGNKLYQRKNGNSPSYVVAHDFSDLSTNINSAVGGIRGLTTIDNPSGPGDALLLMWCPDGQSKGIIYRLEPNGSGGFTRVLETTVATLVQNYLSGSTANYVLGAYNEFYEYFNPLTNQTEHLVGFEATISGGGHPLWQGYYKGALFAKRDASANYIVEEVDGPIGTNDSALVATRCYVSSPFGNNELYFGGFDPNGKRATNKAWIYKKSFWPTDVNDVRTDERISVFPNPVSDNLFIRLSRKDARYEIYSIQGQRILSGNTGRDHSISVSDLPPSIYLLKVNGATLRFLKK